MLQDVCSDFVPKKFPLNALCAHCGKPKDTHVEAQLKTSQAARPTAEQTLAEQTLEDQAPLEVLIDISTETDVNGKGTVHLQASEPITLRCVHRAGDGSLKLLTGLPHEVKGRIAIGDIAPHSSDEFHDGCDSLQVGGFHVDRDVTGSLIFVAKSRARNTQDRWGYGTRTYEFARLERPEMMR